MKRIAANLFQFSRSVMYMVTGCQRFVIQKVNFKTFMF